MSAKTTHDIATGNVSAELIAVIVAVPNGEPMVMTVEAGDALPSGPFELAHRSLQSGLRAWVEQRTGHALGYLEQLYTFADRERGEGPGAGRRISISYLGLTRAEAEAAVARSVARTEAQAVDYGGRLAPRQREPKDPGRNRLRPQRPALERRIGAAALRIAL